MTSSDLVIVVDDDDAVRDSLQVLLETAGYQVRGHASGAALLADVPAAGCILLDIRMPEMDGITVLDRLREQGARLPVIVITGHGDVPLAVRAMKAGAIDFIEKPFDQDQILASLREACANHAREAAGREDAGGRAGARLASLTPREREVLEGLMAGLPNKTIAFDLGISPRTVEIHRARVMEKSGARSLSELVRLGLAAGIEPKAR